MIALLDGVSVAELFGGLMLLLGGVALAVSTRYVWRASTVFRATDQTTFESADAGSFVRISRTVTYDRGDVLIAPFSDSECVTFRYQIEERCLSVLYLSPWHITVHKVVKAVAFDVQTPEDTVSMVEPIKTVIIGKDVITITKSETYPPENPNL